MSVLNAFINPEPIERTKKVIISERFKDENGEVVPFTIKTISQEVNDQLRRKATRMSALRHANGQDAKFDSAKYSALMVVACTVEPKFTDAELCEAYKTMDPVEVPQKMLTPGEYTKLTDAILSLNDFDGDAEEIEEAAKN